MILTCSVSWGGCLCCYQILSVISEAVDNCMQRGKDYAIISSRVAACFQWGLWSIYVPLTHSLVLHIILIES